MYYLIINTKNYAEASGKRLDRLLSLAGLVSAKYRNRVEVYFALPAFYLSYAHTKYPKLKLLAQHIDPEEPGSTTGHLVAEIAKMSGAVGTLANHSEHRMNRRLVQRLIEKLHKLDMISVVCARDPSEVAAFGKFSPDFIAVEPPELIGTGNAVSKSKPKVISDSYFRLEKAKSPNSKTRLLCGAGIVDGNDAKRAVELGASGILVASGVVKAKNWKIALEDLANGLSDARQIV
ncbi:MAG: triose-phosphate isomerase [Thaumarchaeota archaeon]|nr:triose-phosphate isomerase [Nitrososphaerota archaeon]